MDKAKLTRTECTSQLRCVEQPAAYVRVAAQRNHGHPLGCRVLLENHASIEDAQLVGVPQVDVEGTASSATQS